MNGGWFYDVVILDVEHLSYQKIYEELQFNACFYGAEYGLLFEEDKNFMAEQGVSFISLMPEKHIRIDGGGALRLCIEDLLRKIAKKKWSKKNDTFMYLDYDNLGGGAFLNCMPRLFYMKENLPTKCFDKVYRNATADIDNRMFLDIYVMDNAHENEKVHMFIINMMKGIYNLCMGHRGNINYEDYKVIISDGIIRLMKIIHFIGRFIPLKFITFCYDSLAQSVNQNKNCQNNIMDSCAIRCIELKYPKEHFGEGLRLPFANIEFTVPSDYDALQKAMRYQNYMEYPRMSVRKPSHYFNSDIEIW